MTFDHYIGPNTVDDWLTRDHPADGSRLELILGHLHMSPPPSGQYQYAGDELRLVLKHALRDAGRSDLYAVTGVGVRISTNHRIALIPDVAVLNTRPVGTSFEPHDLELVVEIWSPGHAHADRETITAAYTDAGVPFLWMVDQGRLGSTVSTYVLKGGRYVEDTTAGPGRAVTITAAPVPVTLDPASLRP